MSDVARYITEAIQRSGKSQLQISKEVGFDKPNMITMIKQGRTKLPLDRMEALALALEVEKFELIHLTMREYHPGAWVSIRQTLSETPTEQWRPSGATRQPSEGLDDLSL
jgi:ribosome-binding protein aMBF1 (putative translation factor)